MASRKTKFVVLFVLVVVVVNALAKEEKVENVATQKPNAKRAYTGGTGVDNTHNWGPAIQISSSVLQLQSPAGHSVALPGGPPQYQSAIENAWRPMGYEVWLETSNGALQHFQPVQNVPHVASVGGLGVALGKPPVVVGGVFSTDTQVISGLHTQISSSGNVEHRRPIQLSDNIDFNNGADLKDGRPTKSFG